MNENKAFRIPFITKITKKQTAFCIEFSWNPNTKYTRCLILYFNASFSDVPPFSKISQPPVWNQQIANSVVYDPCPSRLTSRLTLTFTRHLTLTNSNLIKQNKISLLFRIKFKQLHIFSAYSKLQCVFTLYVHFSL